MKGDGRHADEPRENERSISITDTYYYAIISLAEEAQALSDDLTTEANNRTLDQDRLLDYVARLRNNAGSIVETISEIKSRPNANEILDSEHVRRALGKANITHQDALETLVASYDEIAVEGQRAQQPRRTRGKNTPNADIQIPIDAVTNTLFSSTSKEGFTTPADYMSGEMKQIRTGKGMSAGIVIENDFELDEAFENYRLDHIDRYWFENVCSIAAEGEPEISGSDLLKLAGYSNPWQHSSFPVMKQAFDSVVKLMRTWVTIDTTKEREAYLKKRGRDISAGVSHRRIISGNLNEDLDSEGRYDFSITLTPEIGKELFTALPLAQYAKNKGQLLTIAKDEEKFPGLRLNIEHRQMWRYVKRRIDTKGTSNTIRVATMFKNLDLQDADSKKKSRMLDMLRRMLEVAKSDGRISGYYWKDEGRSIESFTIELPKKKKELDSPRR